MQGSRQKGTKAMSDIATLVMVIGFFGALITFKLSQIVDTLKERL